MSMSPNWARRSRLGRGSSIRGKVYVQDPMGLSGFHPFVSRWFSDTLGQPTAAQLRGWASIRDRRHTLIAAPTGSGKTLAAFLTAIDDLVQEGLRGPMPEELRVGDVSSPKAISDGIHTVRA